MFLYVVRNMVNGMEYVGTTTRSLSLRWSDHRRYGRTGGRKAPLYDAMREHGVERFSFESLAEAGSYEALMALEIAEIARRNTVQPNGYNVVRGGRGNFGWRMKLETRQQISAKALGRVAWNKGIPHTAEQRAKTSESKKRQYALERANGIFRSCWNKGKKAAPEHIEAMKRSKDSEWRAKQSVAQSGKTLSDETKAKIAAAVSEARKQRFWSSQRVNDVGRASRPKRRGGKQRISYGNIEYVSLKECAAANGLSVSQVYHRIKKGLAQYVSQDQMS